MIEIMPSRLQSQSYIPDCPSIHLDQTNSRRLIKLQQLSSCFRCLRFHSTHTSDPTTNVETSEHEHTKTMDYINLDQYFRILD